MAHTRKRHDRQQDKPPMDLASTLECISLIDTSAPQQWVRAIHATFYASAVRGQSGNKFLELETTLTHVLTTKLHEQQQQRALTPSDGGDGREGTLDELWAFMVRIVLLLSHEPSAADGDDRVDPLAAHAQQSALPVHDALDEKSVHARKREAAAKKVTKKAKKSAQPYAPLAFVVVNALKKLVDACADEVAQSFREHGRTNADLTEFCLRGLEHPDEIVRATTCNPARREAHS